MTPAAPEFPEISGYTITEKIYLGSRTAVYRAVRDNQQLPVVIKVLQREYPAFGELVQFRNQYAIAKNLPIAGIIQPLSLETFGNSYALVMADWGGISLEKYIQQQQLDLTEKLAIALQITDILHELHQHRVIHKDIKPANILIHPESKQIKLIDFSIASVLPKETQEIQNPNTLEGTLAYLAPEQTGRMNRGIDYRSDFYALGVTLYQLFTSHLPFVTNDPLELVHCHIAKIPTPVHQVNTDVPKILGAIVAKLMAKNAEDRYQSALGLKHDLGECLTQWKETESITEFELGHRDLCDRFNIPEKLYGREEEVQTLLDAFERITQGTSELMLVAGFSGIGKTAVVNEVHKPIVKQRGYFIKGKFDQFNRNIPFSAFVQAFRDLMGQLLSESDIQLQNWKTQILEVLGENAQVIVELIPELERIIGNQPPAPELSGSAAQNRFNLLFQRFIQLFTTSKHPLVMFVDDLQWADSASLNLIQVLMSEVKTGCLLLLGAYRDNEVFPAHPLILTLNDMERTGAKINTITLNPLNFTSLNYLVADTLHVPLSVVQPLTELVMQKTQGNPFFATQFLKALYQDQLITFDKDAGHWQCDIVQVRDAALTDDVVEFMALQLQKLPEATQEILKLAACIGAQFDLETLAIVSQKSQTDVATALWKALQEGLILPQSDLYKFYLEETQTTEQQPKGTLNYKFLHDRIQQAAYSLIPDEQKQTTHLKIGQLLLRNTSPGELEENIFSIVNQLNIGRALIIQTTEISQLLELNLLAAQKAKLSTAYSASMQYLEICMELLPKNSWHSQTNLTRTIYEFAAEVAYLNTNYERMEELTAIFLSHTDSLLEKIRVYEIKMLAAKARSELLDSIQIGLDLLRLLGVEFPQEPNPADIGQALQQSFQLWQGREISSLLDAPAMKDPVKLAAMRILTQMVPSAYLAAPFLMPLLIFKQIEISITEGNCEISPTSYADYGLVLCGVVGDLDGGYQFGQLALQLLERFQAKAYKCRVYFVVHSYTSHWQESLKSRLPFFQLAYQAGLETGDLESSALNVVIYCAYAYFAGNELSSLALEMENYQQSLLQLKQEISINFLAIYQQAVLNLLGCADNPCQLTGKVYAETEALPILKQVNNRTALYYLYYNKTFLCYLFGEYEQAGNCAILAESYADSMVGMFAIPLLCFYSSLIDLALLSLTSTTEQTHILEKVANNQQKLKTWADYAPMNHEHKFHLVEAERYRVLGKKTEAIEYYDRAIAGAKDNGYIQEEALANELAAKFYLDWGKEKVAAGYMQEAYYGYSRWGAKAKTDDLELFYPNLLRPILQEAEASVGTWNTLMTIASPTIYVNSSTHESSSSTSINHALDFAAILKASQALSSTIELDRLLHQLTQIILQNSGGDRCALILPNEALEWQVRAIATLDDTQLCTEPLANNPNLPVKLIQYVKNTQEIVVINELKTDLPVLDNYLLESQPKSVLCLPLLNQGQLIGILYLKNQFTIGAFSSDRILILHSLCTQVAISLENARLYQNSQQALQTIQRQEAQYRGIFENVSDGLAIVNLKTTKVVAANPAYYQMHNYSPEELLELKPVDILRPEAYSKFESFLESIQQGKEFICHAICSKQDGTLFNAEIHSVPFWYDGQLCGLTLFRDVTKQKQLESELQKKNHTLEQTLRKLQQAQMQVVQSEKMSALGNLVAGVAHEVNNPIGFLNGSINNAKEYVQDLLEHLKTYQEQQPPNDVVQENAEDIDLEFLLEDLPKLLDTMKGATNRIKSISTSLRTFSRADTDHKVSANLHEGLDSTLLILKYRLKANENRPAIQITQDYGDLPTIECFPGQLNQVFMNILANAIDVFDEMAQTQTYQEIEANPQQITIRTQIESNQVYIRIRDNGKGMSEDVQAKIFDHLFTTKEVGKGTGLGLAIARQIVVEKHGGSLNVWSELGQGTEFCISLPISSK